MPCTLNEVCAMVPSASGLLRRVFVTPFLNKALLQSTLNEVYAVVPSGIAFKLLSPPPQLTAVHNKRGMCYGVYSVGFLLLLS
jgi:hypothetical protein